MAWRIINESEVVSINYKFRIIKANFSLKNWKFLREIWHSIITISGIKKRNKIILNFNNLQHFNWRTKRFNWIN